MQFLVIGRDGKDSEAMDRRMKARPAHIAACDQLKADGKILYGVALLSDAGKMCGSVMFFDVADRAEMDAILGAEPYVTGKVWETVEVSACWTGPTFEKTLEKMKAG